MGNRVFIRIDDDEQLQHIQRIAGELRQAGLELSDVSPVVGQITGTVETSALPGVEQTCKAMGLRLVREESDVVHRLPPEGSDLR